MKRIVGRCLPTCLLGLALAGSLAPTAQAIDHVAWIDDLGLQSGVPLVVLPAEAGAVIAVDEQRKISSYTQTITLQGDPGTVGENRIIVTVTRTGLAPRIEQQTVAAELADRVPDIPVSLGPIRSRNVFGLFGSVAGSTGSLACFYGWQGVDLADKWITGEGTTPFDENHALSIRVRLCRTSLDKRAMLALMSALQSGISGSGEMQPARFGADALAAAAGLGAMTSAMPADPMVAASTEPGWMPWRRRPLASAAPLRGGRLRREAAHQSDAPARPAPIPGMPAVPLPQTGMN